MLPLPCMLVCTFVCANRTRDRGCSKHPVFPAPSLLEEGNQDANLGRNAPRDRESVFRRSYGAAGGQEVRLVVPPTIQPRGSRCLSSIGLTHPPLASMPRFTWFLNRVRRGGSSVCLC